MNVPRCRHIKTDGTPCGSPALKDKPRCFYHHRQAERHLGLQPHSHAVGSSQALAHALPLVELEDTRSIQLALSLVINGLAIGQIDPVRARIIIYGLQVAAANARAGRQQTYAEPLAHHCLVRDLEPGPHGHDLAPEGQLVDLYENYIDPDSLTDEDVDDFAEMTSLSRRHR